MDFAVYALAAILLTAGGIYCLYRAIKGRTSPDYSAQAWEQLRNQHMICASAYLQSYYASVANHYDPVGTINSLLGYITELTDLGLAADETRSTIHAHQAAQELGYSLHTAIKQLIDLVQHHHDMLRRASEQNPSPTATQALETFEQRMSQGDLSPWVTAPVHESR